MTVCGDGVKGKAIHYTHLRGQYRTDLGLKPWQQDTESAVLSQGLLVLWCPCRRSAPEAQVYDLRRDLTIIWLYFSCYLFVVWLSLRKHKKISVYPRLGINNRPKKIFHPSISSWTNDCIRVPRRACMNLTQLHQGKVHPSMAVTLKPCF